jgi:hypothetical protein
MFIMYQKSTCCNRPSASLAGRISSSMLPFIVALYSRTNLSQKFKHFRFQNLPVQKLKLSDKTVLDFRRTVDQSSAVKDHFLSSTRGCATSGSV